MQPVWLRILSGKRFEDTFENAQRRKVKQMQPVWLRILSGRPLKDTFEKTQWRKVEQMQPMWLITMAILMQAIWEDILKLTVQEN